MQVRRGDDVLWPQQESGAVESALPGDVWSARRRPKEPPGGRGRRGLGRRPKGRSRGRSARPPPARRRVTEDAVVRCTKRHVSGRPRLAHKLGHPGLGATSDPLIHAVYTLHDTLHNNTYHGRGLGGVPQEERVGGGVYQGRGLPPQRTQRRPCRRHRPTGMERQGERRAAR